LQQLACLTFNRKPIDFFPVLVMIQKLLVQYLLGEYQPHYVKP